MKAGEDWLREYKKKHPDRVNDVFDESEPENLIKAVRWEFDVLVPTYNETLRLFKHRPADYYSKIRRWQGRFFAVARVEYGPGANFDIPVRVHMIRRTTGKVDVDGLYGSFKIPLDALVRSGLLPDDNPDVIRTISAESKKVTSDEKGTTFIINSVE